MNERIGAVTGNRISNRYRYSASWQQTRLCNLFHRVSHNFAHSSLASIPINSSDNCIMASLINTINLRFKRKITGQKKTNSSKRFISFRCVFVCSKTNCLKFDLQLMGRLQSVEMPSNRFLPVAHQTNLHLINGL